jgi:hypothetical protein
MLSLKDKEARLANRKAPPSGDGNNEVASEKKKTVRVILKKGLLGTKLLKFGDISSDPDYVALIGDERNLVEEVIENETKQNPE